MGTSQSRPNQTQVGNARELHVELFKNKYLLQDPIIGRISFTSDEDLTDVNCFIQLLCHNSAEYKHNFAQIYKVDNVIFTGDQILLCTLDNTTKTWTIDFRLEHNINRPSINLANGRLKKMQIEYNLVVSIKRGAQKQILIQDTVPIEMIEVNTNLNSEIYSDQDAIGLPSSWCCGTKPTLLKDLQLNKLEYLAGEKCNINLHLEFHPKQSVSVAALRFLLCQEFIINNGKMIANPRIILDQVINNQINNEELQFKADLTVPKESQTQTSGFYMRTNYYIAIQIFFQNSQSRNNLEIIVPIKVWSLNTQEQNQIEFKNNDKSETVSYEIPDAIRNKIINYVPEQHMNLRYIGNPSLDINFQAEQQNEIQTHKRLE